jgi:hypothetical protein
MFGIYAYSGLENSFPTCLLTSGRLFAGWLPFVGLGTADSWTASDVAGLTVGRLYLSSLLIPAFLSLWKIQYASLLMLSLYSLIPVLKKAGRPYANPAQNKQTTVQNQPTFVANEIWNTANVSYDNYTTLMLSEGLLIRKRQPQDLLRGLTLELDTTSWARSCDLATPHIPTIFRL